MEQQPKHDWLPEALEHNLFPAEVPGPGGFRSHSEGLLSFDRSQCSPDRRAWEMFWRRCDEIGVWELPACFGHMMYDGMYMRGVLAHNGKRIQFDAQLCGAPERIIRKVADYHHALQELVGHQPGDVERAFWKDLLEYISYGIYVSRDDRVDLARSGWAVVPKRLSPLLSVPKSLAFFARKWQQEFGRDFSEHPRVDWTTCRITQASLDGFISMFEGRLPCKGFPSCQDELEELRLWSSSMDAGDYMLTVSGC